MSLKKNTKKKNSKRKIKSNENGLTKLATLTTKSLSNAYSNYKKRQELNKIKEIKLKKLQENNEIIREKKELRIFEEKLKKEDTKLRFKEEELKQKEKIAL